MHYVDRGPEPPALAAVRDAETPKWVAHYQPPDPNNRPTKPNGKWSAFQPELAERFGMLCAYCERTDQGEVEHFKPKSSFPELTYVWQNWTLACPTCNRAKGDKWPSRGYVDPCARQTAQRPEAYFDFDLLTCELIPRGSLTGVRRQRAQSMIAELKLNRLPLLKARKQYLRVLDATLSGPNTANVAAFATSGEQEFCSLARSWARQHRL